MAPEATVTAERAGRAAKIPNFSVPAFTVVVPAYKLATLSSVIPASFLTRFPAVAMAPLITVDPVATAPVPAKIISDVSDFSVPEIVSTPAALLLVMVSASLNWMLAEIVSPVEAPTFVMEVPPDETSMNR